MAGVFIDIPGVGNVEAKNAATEATLREILKAMQGVQKNTGGSSAGGAGGAGGGAGGGGNAGAANSGKSVGFLGRAANSVGQAMGKLSSKVMPVVGGFNVLNNALTGTIAAFANVEDDVGAAAKTIPILGGLFGTVADQAKKVNKAFLDASTSGATFGGSVSNLAASASAAGMTMDKFAALVSKNGQGMLGFGGTTEEGAKRFAQVSKSLRATSSDLYALGYSTEDINGGLAKYGELLRAQGLQGKKSNGEMVDGAKKYLKELDQLAKITGEERSAKEAEMKKLAQDAQFQAAMAGKSEDVRASFMKTVTALPGPLQGFVKDFLATGTLTSEETQRIGAMMGGEVMNELQNMRNKMQSGQALTAAEQDRLAAIMKSAAEKQLKANGTALAASREMDGATNAMASALQLQTNAHQNAAKEQGKAAKEGDGFNKKMQQMQQTLAQFSNMFSMVLAKSGVLDLMMNMFTGLATLVQNIVVPAFNIFSGIIVTVGNFLMGTLTPVFRTLGDFIGNWVYPAFLQLGGFIMAEVVPIFQWLGSTLSSIVTPVFEWLGGVLSEYVTPAFESIAGFIEENLSPILWGLGAAYLALNAQTLAYNAGLMIGNTIRAVQNGLMLLTNLNLMALASAALVAAGPFLLIAAPVLLVVALLKKLYDSGWSLGTAWDAVKDNLERFGMSIMEFIDNIRAKLPDWAGGMSKDEQEARAKLREERRKELDQKEAARDLEREKLAKERSEESGRDKRHKEAAKLDNKLMGHTKKIGDGLGKTAKTVDDANKTIDANAGSEGLLKQMAVKEGSYLVPPKEAAAKAESTKKEVERKGEEKAAAEKRAQDEAEAKKAAEEKARESEGKKSAPAQESAESLLAQLNTHMARLIKLSEQTTTNTYEQVVATKGLTQDLFKSV